MNDEAIAKELRAALLPLNDIFKRAQKAGLKLRLSTTYHQNRETDERWELPAIKITRSL